MWCPHWGLSTTINFTFFMASSHWPLAHRCLPAICPACTGAHPHLAAGWIKSSWQFIASPNWELNSWKFGGPSNGLNCLFTFLWETLRDSFSRLLLRPGIQMANTSNYRSCWDAAIFLDRIHNEIFTRWLAPNLDFLHERLFATHWTNPGIAES